MDFLELISQQHSLGLVSRAKLPTTPSCVSYILSGVEIEKAQVFGCQVLILLFTKLTLGWRLKAN